MICQRCLRRFLRISPSGQRPLSSTTVYHAEGIAPRPRPQSDGRTTTGDHPAATSTSAAQPFSVPLSASPIARGLPKSNTPPSPIVRSSVAAGTPLKGLNFLKGQSDPLAMEDHEYPDWLWRILEDKKLAAETVDGDVFSKSRSKRAKALKKAKKAAALNPEAEFAKVPVYEQTVDLPAGDGTVDGAIQAEDARTELTKAMRAKRRATIKEQNFLKTMS